MPSNHQAKQDPPLPWSAFLDELDQALSEPIALHCIGGFVVSLLYGFPRPTGDIDYISAIPRRRLQQLEDLGGRGSELEAKYKVHLQHVTVATMPEDYEARLREMFPLRFKKLRLLAPDAYDLVLSKTRTEQSEGPRRCRIPRKDSPFRSKGPAGTICSRVASKMSWHARPGTTAP